MDQQPLLAHLIELRNRLVRIAGVLLVVLLCLVPWAGDVYHLFAKPLMDVLPQNSIFKLLHSKILICTARSLC